MQGASQRSAPRASEGGQSILFTVDRRVVTRERDNVYVHYQVSPPRPFRSASVQYSENYGISCSLSYESFQRGKDVEFTVISEQC